MGSVQISFAIVCILFSYVEEIGKSCKNDELQSRKLTFSLNDQMHLDLPSLSETELGHAEIIQDLSAVSKMSSSCLCILQVQWANVPASFRPEMRSLWPGNTCFWQTVDILTSHSARELLIVPGTGKRPATNISLKR